MTINFKYKDAKAKLESNGFYCFNKQIPNYSDTDGLHCYISNQFLYCFLIEDESNRGNFILSDMMVGIFFSSWGEGSSIASTSWCESHKFELGEENINLHFWKNIEEIV